MGGGDLNLKKSWHPQTLRNVEKVWMAEQKAEAEAKKIEQLQRELNEEREREEMQRYAVDQGIAKKKSDRLEWMYSAPGHSGVNHEDYLLGKSIDKAVDPMAVNDEKNADAPGASFMEDSSNASTDLANKIRDDPLFMIKKKETEKKKELLKNPVRMKQLQEMLKNDLSRKSEKKSKKEKKKRKKEKKNKYSSDDEDDRMRRNSRKRQEASRSDQSTSHDKHIKKNVRNSSTERRGHVTNHCNYKSEHSPKRRSDRSNRESSSDEADSHSRIRDSLRSKEHSSSRGVRASRSCSPRYDRRNDRRSLSSSPSPDKRQARYGETSRNYSRKRKTEISSREEISVSSKRENYKDGSNVSPIKASEISHRSRNGKKDKGVTRKMTQEERERKLAEMMDNAKWRDEQRGQNVKRYKKEDEEEAMEISKNKNGASFVRPMKVDTFTSSTASVENRIKRNINSLQRTPAAMENFLKK